jgi:DNA-binding CsgD family transcriptional regulator
MGRSELYFYKYIDELQSKKVTATKSTSFYLKKYAFLQKFIGFMPSAFYVLNYQTQKFQYLSPEIKSILGFEAAEIKSISYSNFLNGLHPEDAVSFNHTFFLRFINFIINLDDDAVDKFRFSVSYRIATREGIYIKLLDQFIVLECDADNHPILVLGLFHDISHHKTITGYDSSILQLESTSGFNVVNEKPTCPLKLTQREREILVLIQKGETSKAIAVQLHISPFTVNKHRANMFEKFNVKNTSALMSYCLTNSLIALSCGFLCFRILF